MTKLKVYYRNFETQEELHVDELPREWMWYEKAFWKRYIELDLTQPENDFDSWDWTLEQFLPPNILIFSFNDEEYVQDD